MGQDKHIASRTFIPALLLVGAASLVEAAPPAQFVAKMYTEALGRAPDQDGWMGNLDFIAANGCSQATLKAAGKAFYVSGEYKNLGYDNAAKLLTAYRGVLSREPDAVGYASWLAALDNGTAFEIAIDGLFDSPEFQGKVAAICSGAPYGFGNSPAINLPVSSSGGPSVFIGGTGAQLQALLNAATPGSAVLLAQKAVVRLTAPLVIPVGVTLTTVGSPLPNQYARMGRIVRDPGTAGRFAQGAVEFRSGAALSHVWVDGQRSPHGGGAGVSDAINVFVPLGGSGMSVVNTRLSDTLGWTNLQALGSGEGQSCGGLLVASNLVTAYATSHPEGRADGLSSACENTTFEFNQIVDTTDVGIVVFRAGTGAAAQHSQVRFNTIVNAGNSLFAAIVADPIFLPVGIQDFMGMAVHDNTLWTGPLAHFDIGLGVGSRPWFGDIANRGTGASFVNNTTGPNLRVFTRANSAIVVSGMMNAQVANNLRVELVDTNSCPLVFVGASVSAGWASGNIQPYTDVDFPACISH